jgi:hypothetical protein
MATLASIYQRSNVFGLQETKLARDVKYSTLERFMPNHELFLGNSPSNHNTTVNCFTAGVLIGVEKKLRTDFLISCPPVPLALQGHVLAVTANSKSKQSRGFIVCNLRYLTKDRLAEQEGQSCLLRTWLMALSATMAEPIIYLMGDFNFVDSQEDTTSNFQHTPRPQHDKLIHEFGLREVVQPCHTFYFKSQDPSVIPRSARLDRIYSNLTEADLAVAVPLAYLPVNSIAGKAKFNEHLPLAAVFAGPPKSKSSFRLPASTVLNPVFTKTFAKLWGQEPKSGLGPFEKMEKFKKTLKKTHFTIRSSNDRNSLGLFVAAIRLLTVLSHPNPEPVSYREILASYPTLGSFISKTCGNWNLGDLRDYVNNRFAIDGVPAETNLPTDNSCDRETLANIPSLPTRTKISNALANIKLTLPSSRTTIKMLRPNINSEPSDDPNVLGDIIQNHYGSLWKNDERNKDDCTADYLQDYDNHIDLNLFKSLSLELIARAVVNAPDSSCGPDGIPFSAYKALSDIANPLLLDCALALQENNLPLSNFNRARLTLLPKKSTLLVDDTRPICVNNTDNRIIAKALVYCACDAAQLLIGDYQKMFLPGRQMTDHLFSLNEDYYGSWREQRQHYVLFTDNKKAFDSIHHNFIFSVLAKQGFPPWFVNMVRSLLSDATAFSGLSPDYDIPICRGVKQGCPLSPLLFLLIYDPLISKLQKTHVTVRAAADDLALSCQSLETLIRCFPLINDFTEVSGMGINVGKTKVLSTIYHPCPYEAARSALNSSVKATIAANAAKVSLTRAVLACSTLDAPSNDSPSFVPPRTHVQDQAESWVRRSKRIKDKGLLKVRSQPSPRRSAKTRSPSSSSPSSSSPFSGSSPSLLSSPSDTPSSSSLSTSSSFCSFFPFSSSSSSSSSPYSSLQRS